MSQPTPGAVHVDTPLSNISVAFLQNASNFVAARVFPNVPVMKQSDRYYTYDRGYFNRDEAGKRAPGTESKGSGYKIDNTPTYFADVWAWHHDVPDQVRANADPQVDPDRDAANIVAHKLLIRRENDWAERYFRPGVWANDFVGVASGTPDSGEFLRWDNENSDPIGFIRARKTDVLESTGFEPNKMTLSKRGFDALVDHPDIIDRVKYSGGVGNTNPARASVSVLAQLFELEEILIGKAIQNKAKEGDANDHEFIMNKGALLSYSPPAPSLMTPSAGYTFSWRGFMGQENPFGFATKRFYIDTIESTRIEGQMAFDHKVVSDELGVYMDAVVS